MEVNGATIFLSTFCSILLSLILSYILYNNFLNRVNKITTEFLDDIKDLTLKRFS